MTTRARPVATAKPVLVPAAPRRVFTTGTMVSRRKIPRSPAFGVEPVADVDDELCHWTPPAPPPARAVDLTRSGDSRALPRDGQSAPGGSGNAETPLAPCDDIRAEIARAEIDVGPTVEGVGAWPAPEPVVARATDDRVVAVLPEGDVVAGLSEDPVAPLASQDDVPTPAPAEKVITTQPDDDVVPAAGQDDV